MFDIKRSLIAAALCALLAGCGNTVERLFGENVQVDRQDMSEVSLYVGATEASFPFGSMERLTGVKVTDSAAQ